MCCSLVSGGIRTSCVVSTSALEKIGPQWGKTGAGRDLPFCLNVDIPHSSILVSLCRSKEKSKWSAELPFSWKPHKPQRLRCALLRSRLLALNDQETPRSLGAAIEFPCFLHHVVACRRTEFSGLMEAVSPAMSVPRTIYCVPF